MLDLHWERGVYGVFGSGVFWFHDLVSMVIMSLERAIPCIVQICEHERPHYREIRHCKVIGYDGNRVLCTTTGDNSNQ